MVAHPFSVKQAFSISWEIFKKNWKFLVLTYIILVVTGMIPSILGGWSDENAKSLSPVFSIIGWIVQMVTGIGIIVISLKLLDNKKAEYADLFKHYRLLLNYTLGSILYTLIVGGIPIVLTLSFFAIMFMTGQDSSYSYIFLVPILVLIFLPFIIYLSLKYQFYSYFVIDKKMGPIESLKASAKATNGHKWYLLFFGLMSGLVALLGFLALGVGILVAMPVVSLAGAYVYRKLS